MTEEMQRRTEEERRRKNQEIFNQKDKPASIWHQIKNGNFIYKARILEKKEKTKRCLNNYPSSTKI